MAKIEKILCAVDFSKATPCVADYAATIAKALEAEVLVLYVAPSMNRYGLFQVSPQEIKQFASAISSGAKENMEQCVKEHFREVRVRAAIVSGYAPEAILQTATDEKCDLIVIGTHGRADAEHVFFGLVAEKVVKQASIPVMTVRP